MKKVLAIAAVAALTAGVSAYAANPFSDVSTDDWAYQAVSQLSDQGIVEGYPDGTFRGERNITRYELAQIVARLMANEDQYNAEQRATIDKLAGEYADELNNLGVRVSNLEAKVGNISWSGDARMRWNQTYDDDQNSDSSFNGRMRINAKAQVNDNTYVDGLLRSDLDYNDNSEDNNTYMQRLYVHHDFGNHVGVNLGKYAEFFGQTGMFFDSEVKGGEVTYTASDAFRLTAGYGRFADWDANVNTGKTTGEIDTMGKGKDSSLNNVVKNNAEFFYAEAAGSANWLDWDIDYVKAFGDSKVNTWGAGLTAHLTDKWDVYGDFYKNTDADGDPQAWTAGLGYGHADIAKAGTFGITVGYISAEKNALLGGYTYDTSALDALENRFGTNKVHFWNVGADVTLAKNLNLHGEYDFSVDTNGADKDDFDNVGAVTLNYVF